MAKYDWTEKLVNMAFGAGSFHNPSQLLENPEAPEDKWRRRDPVDLTGSDVISEFTDEQLGEMFTYLADMRASWRVSNAKARIREVEHAKQRVQERNAANKTILALFEANLGEMALENFGRARCIQAYTDTKVLMPEALKK